MLLVKQFKIIFCNFLLVLKANYYSLETNYIVDYNVITNLKFEYYLEVD